MKRILSKGLAVVLALAACTGCKSTEGETFHYVNLSQVLCTFLGEENQPLEITVKASPADYEVAPGASWLKAEKSEDGKTLTLTVEDNETGAERSTTVTVEAGQAVQQITVNQLAKDNEFVRYRRLETFQSGAAISPNGKYVGGFVPSIAPDDSWQYSPTIIDMETGDVYEFGPYPESLILPTSVSCVTSQGLMYVVNGQGDMFAFDMHERNYFIPEVAGYATIQVNSSSADGTKWVGRATGKGETMYVPLISENGTVRELPMTELNYRNEPHSMGIIARGISADGSIAYGTIWDNLDFGMVYWKDWQNGGQAEYVGKDVHVRKVEKALDSQGLEYDYYCADGMICQANRTNISPSGKWIAGSYRTWTLAENRMDAVTSQVAAFYDVETETTVIVDEYGESTGTHVTDDGIGFIGLGSLGISSGRVYDCNTRTDLGTTQEWVYDNYGIIIPNCYVTSISPDGTVVFGRYLESSAGGHMKFPGWYVAPPVAE